MSSAVLNWLHSVLISEYQDVRRTYSDVAEALTHYPSLTPRTEVYTYENGASALLLQVHGTIPVQFRGTTYRFPISLWIPHAYPKESPMAYVTPAQDMLVRPGQHVSSDGRVYHPYLAQWATYWDKSSIFDFLAVLRGVFAKEPPVISKQQVHRQPVQQAPPPPVPPPPEEWRRSQQPQPQFDLRGGGNSAPPPLPPKGADGGRSSTGPLNTRPFSGQNGPPLPPLPSTQTPHQQYQYAPPNQNQWQDGRASMQYQAQQHQPQRQATLDNIPSPYRQQQQQLPPHMRFQQNPHELESPVSPITPDPPNPNWQWQQPPDPRAYQQGQAQPPNYAHQQGPPPQPKPQPQPTIDLLTSPFDVTLPSQTGSVEPLPVPPVPPNPQKDALLNALSQALVSQTNQIITSNNNAATSLEAQQFALRGAHAVLQAELEQLEQLDRALESNERILRGAMQEAEQVMRDAQGRRRPEVDEVLVCPTVVGGQLYTLVAEEKACEEARLALGRGLDKGRLGLEVFVKQTRTLAREEFLKKALIRKVGKGMGLDDAKWR
ncbi:UEV-domain-containing protein [Venturia nashicola]|uniref:UEV-domain-containing protein n=1 Tax=Venturia nashicola TaxID=86259 RepID=A0A4Z1NQI9_9PEZI|nr:UEV-domain-containing protein [Venturia nashicola]TLD27893.1 UEV-domain-containing protein [Venturia nashicola]